MSVYDDCFHKNIYKKKGVHFWHDIKTSFSHHLNFFLCQNFSIFIFSLQSVDTMNVYLTWSEKQTELKLSKIKNKKEKTRDF